MSARGNGRFVSAMKLTSWVFLVALGSAGVANAAIGQIGCDGQDDDDRGKGALGGDTCYTWAAALNQLDGVSGLDCGGNYPYLFDPESPGHGGSGVRCTKTAAALNKLGDGVSNISCDDTWGFLAVPHADCPGGPSGTLSRLAAILQGPTCEHGTPVPGPTGGGNCTGPCEQGWQGSNCDSPGHYVCNSSTYRCDLSLGTSSVNISSCLKTCTKPPPPPPPPGPPPTPDQRCDAIHDEKKCKSAGGGCIWDCDFVVCVCEYVK